jgi:tetratricopeptide (TPR) repeat protein
MNKTMSRQLTVFVLLSTLFASPLMAQAPSKPLTQDEVRDLIRKNKKDPEPVYKALDERKVDFDLNRDIERKMRKAGADDAVLQAMWKAGPTSRNAKTALLTSATGVQLQATYEEAMGFQTLQDEPDPGRKFRMVEEFEKRFPNSQLLSYVYTQAAEACQKKGDLNGLVDYGEKSLKLDPDDIFSMLLVAIVLPQPRMLQASPEVVAQRLLPADAHANRPLKLIDSLPKSANETDEQFQKRKASLASDAHTALAMVYMHRGDSGKASEEFKTAISLTAKPNP